MKSYKPRGALRRRRQAQARARRPGAQGRAPHGRQPPRQRRHPPPRPPAARLPRLRRRGAQARCRRGRGHAGPGPVPPRRDEAQRGPNFRVFGPDETASNRWGAVFEETDRGFTGEILRTDDHVSPDGRVMEVLSEHMCQGWLEGYLLTGRHGFFSCYEAFIHIIDSMFNQHAKWLKVTRHIPWRRPIASLNYLLTSHVWRQDHNGFSHQDPGFIDHVVNKKAEIIRIYLPPDANTLLSRHRPLPAEPQLRQRHRGRQAARAPVARHGRGRQALHRGHRHLGMGQQRPGRRARRGHGLLRRRPDPGDPRRRRDAPQSSSRS